MNETNRLRNILEMRNGKLYSEFRIIEDKAKKLAEYNQLYGDTLNGLTHIKDVESKIDRLIPDTIKDKLNNFELFVLLSAIYLHDIGKIKNYKIHPSVSKNIIEDFYNNLGIQNKHVAKTIAQVAFGHGDNNIIYKLPKKHNVDNYGDIDIRFISALLRLGDDLSITYQRAPDFVKNLLEKNNINIDKWNLRENIAGIIIDPNNWMIKVQVLSPPANFELEFKKLWDFIQKRLDEIIPILDEKEIFYQRIRLEIYHDMGVEKIIRERRDVTGDEWRDFYKNTKSNLNIMGQSMRDVFEKNKDIIINLLKEDKKCRVLLLDPFDYTQQIYEVDNGLSQELLKTRDTSLKEKIKGTLKILFDIQSIAKKRNYPGKLYIKVTNKLMYCSMSIVDDTMYINPYSNNPEGDKCPTLLLKKEEDEGLFYFYKEEFIRMWRTANYPQKRINGFDINKRIFQYYKEIRKTKNFVSKSNNENLNKITLPLPKMAIIYPTYRCSLKCPNCMYDSYRKRYIEQKKNLDIDIETFEHILRDLTDLKVNCIEISGGGEPLEHKKIDKLIDVIALIKKEKTNIKFGLLTNGLKLMGLKKSTLESIAQNFTYIRFSYSELAQNKTQIKVNYLDNLGKFIKKYGSNQRPQKNYCLRVGAKILLTKENKNRISELISEVYDMGVDHVKIKSIRSAEIELSDDDIFDIEDELNGFMFAKQQQEDLQIDIRKTNFPKKFHCWINPLFTTIDPLGRVFICYNFHNDDKSMEIGNYNNNLSLVDFWGKEDHKEKINRINTESICKASDACNCRFVDYQNIIEEMISYEEIIEFKFQKYFKPHNEIPILWKEIFPFL